MFAEVSIDGGVLAGVDELEELGEQVRRQMLLGPPTDATSSRRSRSAAAGGRNNPNRPAVVVERLQPLIPAIGVHELVQHQRSTGLARWRQLSITARTRSPSCSQQQRVVQSKPPDPRRVGPVAMR